MLKIDGLNLQEQRQGFGILSFKRRDSL